MEHIGLIKMISSILYIILLAEISFSSTVEISTKVGKIIGKTSEIDIDGNSVFVNEFLGIPFAKSPTGNLRFRKPEPMDVFNDPYNATSLGPICPQGGFEIVSLKKFKISEDCLLLNVFVPRPRIGDEKFAVMIYIHGGLFITGASNFYVSDVLSAYGNVIVVTINYRLSIFGFLSTSDKNSKGNYGLWDQQMAIKWIHDNIAGFNGDPKRVTLFGQSAGAISAIYQSMFPGNKGLFQRVIAESGTPVTFGVQRLQHWYTRSANNNNFAHKFGCPYTLSGDILECLREKQMEDIVTYVQRSFQQVRFEPVIDGEFLTAEPMDILEERHAHLQGGQTFGSVDLLIGGNSMEGASYLQFMWKALLLIPDINTFYITERQFKGRIVPKVLQQIYGRHVSKFAVDAVAIRYTDVIHSRNIAAQRNMLLQLSTDYGFRIPNLKTAVLHQNYGNSKTYMYEFKVKPSFTIGKYARPIWVTEANHGDESMFVFGFSKRTLSALDINDTYRPTAEEWKLSKTLMKAWTNFAKYGDPNERINDSVGNWPEFTVYDSNYLDISMYNKTVYVSPQIGYCEPAGSFWLHFMPQLMENEDVILSKSLKNDKHILSIFDTQTSSIVLIGLGICTILLLLSLAVTCFMLQKKTKNVSYNAVEV